MKFTFDNTYAKLPERFFERVNPTPVKAPKLLKWNDDLAAELGIDAPNLDRNILVEIFSGNQIPIGADPIAQAYSGYQFGHFATQLGDGRAHLLGEILDRSGKRFDLQLKGSGPTRFSRRGDGRAALGPMIREYILGEAMHSLGIPTTRALALVATGEPVFRESTLPGAILTRIAASHIRVGTFEYFSSRKDLEAIQILADYTIDRHYPQCRSAENPNAALFEAILISQAELIARWMCVGFIHGVMNTDNMAISGETIDYGPCAFMDAYNPDAVFSSIDKHGRYSYKNQAPIAYWNLAQLGQCLLPIEILNKYLEIFPISFHRFYSEGMGRKIGLQKISESDLSLIEDLLNLFTKFSTDFTIGFAALTNSIAPEDDTQFLILFNHDPGAVSWLSLWKGRIDEESASRDEIMQLMSGQNPSVIARNHQVEKAIRAASDLGDFMPFENLLRVLKNPFDVAQADEAYKLPPTESEIIQETFCGT